MDPIFIDGVLIKECIPDELNNIMEPHIKSGKMIVFKLLMEHIDGKPVTTAKVRMRMEVEKTMTDAVKSFYEKFPTCEVYTSDDKYK